MRTVRNSSHLLGGGCLLGGVPAPRGSVSVPGGCLLLGGACSQGRGVSAPGGCLLRGGGRIPACTEADPPSCGQTHRCKNITFATSLRTVIISTGSQFKFPLNIEKVVLREKSIEEPVQHLWWYCKLFVYNGCCVLEKSWSYLRYDLNFLKLYFTTEKFARYIQYQIQGPGWRGRETWNLWGSQSLGGRQHTNLPDFPKNCMKLRKFWSIGGRTLGEPPLGSATDYGPFRPIGSVTDQYFISFNLLICCQQLQVSGGSRISPRRGRQLPGGGGANIRFCQIFLKNCMKLKEFGPPWAGTRDTCPPPPP